MKATPKRLKSGMSMIISNTSWTGPDHGSFLDVWNIPPLIRYMRALREHFGYAKFLGLPKIKDEQDIPLRNLYVEPVVSPTRISPDAPPETWPVGRTSPLRALLECGRLMLLGDPGSGKSTLVGWICCQLAEPMGSLWTQHLHQSVPLPFIVRDLKIGLNITWDTLLNTFLAQGPGKSLAGNRDLVLEILERGQALILVDGLDEIGNTEVLTSLRNALLEGLARYPQCRWLATSRIVGYDRVLFDKVDEFDTSLSSRLRAQIATLVKQKLVSKGETYRTEKPGEPPNRHELVESSTTIFYRRYLAPFDDKQIAEFAMNWWLSREKREAEAEGVAGELVAAIHAHPGTERLARIPNLLAMMALIHRTRAQLPYGRSNLYEEIGQAYLHTIDYFRNIDQFEYRYEDKRYWLAKVGYEMQRQRGQWEGDPEILATERDVLHWIVEAMDEYGFDPDIAQGEASAFLDHVVRRSGLLIPRGEGYFAFVHLSFQEFFAAVYLAEQIQGGLLPDSSCTREESYESNAPLDPGLFASFAREVVWREPLLLLFEQLPKALRTPDRVAGGLFSSATFQPFQSNVLTDGKANEDDETLAHILASVAIDPYSHLSSDKRTMAWHACWVWALSIQQTEPRKRHEDVSRVLLSVSEDYKGDLWYAMEKAWGCSGFRNLRLTGLQSIPSLIALEGLKSLELTNCPAMVDIAPLSTLKALTYLHISYCASLTDLTPLSYLTDMKMLGIIACDNVANLSPLQSLESLKLLTLLDCKGVNDLAPLNSLSEIEYLCLSYCQRVKDLTPLGALATLQELDLSGCIEIRDIAPLSVLGALQHLNLSDCESIQDFSPLRALRALQHLDLSNCAGVEVLTPLDELFALEYLNLTLCTGLNDLRPLCALKSLQRLDIPGCSKVTDLSPLIGLDELTYLNIIDCVGLSEVPKALRIKPGLTIVES